MTHPLDRPVWTSLTTDHARFASGGALAKRIDPAIGIFVAMADRSDAARAAFAALIDGETEIGLVETEPFPHPPGFTAEVWPLAQMVATAPATDEPRFAYRPLTDADAPAMLALATLTRPGPFRIGTHRLGNFYGVEQDGRLVAMAGMRLSVPGFTEISGVCTHPDHRGRGYAGGLMRRVARDIAATGDACFLHARAENAGAIALYESLGFRIRASIDYTILTREPPQS